VWLVPAAAADLIGCIVRLVAANKVSPSNTLAGGYGMLSAHPEVL
jgi:hypothetical protein